MPQKPSPKRLSKFFSTDKQISGNFCKTEADCNHADYNHNKYTRTHVYARVRTYRTHVYARMREKTFVRNLPATDSFLPLRVTLSRTDATKAEKFHFCPVDGVRKKGISK